MELLRKPFQGVTNIIRFNWPLYLLAFIIIIFLVSSGTLFPGNYSNLFTIAGIFIAFSVLTSLLVSFYVYDLSGLYSLKNLDEVELNSAGVILNISAGFDEWSGIIQLKYPGASLKIFDFYDERKHTEASIKRARRAYPLYSGTQIVSTAHLPLQDEKTDIIFVMFSAHEIRNNLEREIFFKELTRTLKPSGKIIVVEHLRDPVNFIAYNIGAFHFLTKRSWYKTFRNAGLNISHEFKITPFITKFILRKNGTTT